MPFTTTLAAVSMTCFGNLLQNGGAHSLRHDHLLLLYFHIVLIVVLGQVGLAGILRVCQKRWECQGTSSRPVCSHFPWERNPLRLSLQRHHAVSLDNTGSMETNCGEESVNILRLRSEEIMFKYTVLLGSNPSKDF